MSAVLFRKSVCQSLGVATLALGVALGVFLSDFPSSPRPVFADKTNVCAVPGKDGITTTVSGVVNTYYPGTGTVNAGATSISVGTVRAGGGPAIANGDLLLVIQMQGADIAWVNDETYGNGVGTAGTLTNTIDYSTANAYAGGQLIDTNFRAGNYEYVVAAGPVAGNSVPIRSALVNTYITAAFDNAGGTRRGQRRFQVIRVPQYSSATLGGTLTPLLWDGGTGGVVALDVAGALNWNSQAVNVGGSGFRGGGGRQLTGGSGTNLDYRTAATNNANGSKGEGIAGTPRYLNDSGALLDNGAAAEGYPNGSYARGAPGNAGGGGTDGNITNNEENSGGGGGANGGYGGKGGRTWSSNLERGGFGGAPAFSTFSAVQLVMGGGGGAGTTNNGTPSGAGFHSSGAAGGGSVMIRAGSISGTGTINANGATAYTDVENDGSGGGGAGGSVLVVSKGGSVGTLTVNAQGGNGGNNVVSGGHTAHGPGGGGGGGVVYTSGSIANPTNAVSGGSPGWSITSGNNYGATAGGAGVLTQNITSANVTYGIAGTNCLPALTVTKTTSTPYINVPGTITWTITVTNQSGVGTAIGTQISDTLPSASGSNVTYTSTTSIVTSGAVTRTATVTPTAGDRIPTWGTWEIAGGGSVIITFRASAPSGIPVNTVLQNPANTSYSDPTRTSTSAPVTPGGAYQSGGGSAGGSNYASGSSTGENVTIWGPTAVKLSSFTGSASPALDSAQLFVGLGIGMLALAGIGVFHARKRDRQR